MTLGVEDGATLYGYIDFTFFGNRLDLEVEFSLSLSGLIKMFKVWRCRLTHIRLTLG